MTVTYYGHQQVTKTLFFQQLVDTPPSVIAIDTETISLKEKLPIGFAIAVFPQEAWWFSSYPKSDLEIQMLISLLSNPAIKKVYANAMFDIRVQPLIFQDFHVDESNIADVLVMARILGRTNARLTDLAAEVGMSAQDAKDLLDEYGKQTMLDLPPEIVSAKCANDAKVTLALYHHFAPQLERLEGLSPDYLDVESKVVPILVDMSLRGLAIDQDARAAMERKTEADRDYYKNLCEEHDFNPGSGMQAGFILAKRGNFLPFTKSKKQLKTDEETLEALDDPLAAVVLGYKRATSILTKYLYPLRDKDRIYTEYGLDTEVGRTKSSDFNMQNIPSLSSRVGIDVRHIFIPDSGTFTTGDFSQLHLRFLAHMSGDTEMKQVYEEGKDGGDIHVSTMKKIHKHRSIAKIINYAIPYGGDPHTLAKQLNTRNLGWCSKLIDEWFDAYPDAAEWIKEARRYAARNGKALPTLFGRQIAVPEEWNRWGKLDIAAMERKGANYPILGSDGEVMKRALIICSAHKLPLAVQVHDSITCLDPDTPVLKGDLTWLPISAIQAGDSLVGIDENKEGKGHRHLRLSIVESKTERLAPAYIITLSNEEIIIASADHRWLALNLKRKNTGQGTSPKTGWIRTDELVMGTELKYIGKPWELGGGRAINFTQNEGVVLDNYVAVMRNLGFTTHTYKHAEGKVVNVSLLQENLRLLGMTRPPRLLAKATDYWEGRVLQFDKVSVVAMMKVSNATRLIDLKTSTKTFIANGLVSHNCDGDCVFPVAALESLAPVKTPFEVDKSERWK